MNGKTKIVAAVAAGAVALTIGAGAARCSMDAPDAQNGQQAPQEQASGNQDDAKAHSPYATSAAWDKEVWIDYGAHSTLTTFTLDDAASTIVTVSVSQDGAMEAV